MKDQQHRRPSAEKRHPDLFAVMDAILDRLHLWIDLANIPDDGSAIGFTKMALLVRALNQYRAIFNTFILRIHGKDIGSC